MHSSISASVEWHPVRLGLIIHLIVTGYELSNRHWQECYLGQIHQFTPQNISYMSWI